MIIIDLSLINIIILIFFYLFTFVSSTFIVKLIISKIKKEKHLKNEESVKDTGFIIGQLPILESISRFFLANGNQPLTLEELGEKLSERRGGDTSRTSEEILLRLLKSAQYYGLRPAPS